MTKIFASISLLGPQNPRPVVVDEVDRLEIGDRVATITAGWQEREAEDDELRAHLRRTVVDLELHRRCDLAFAADPELFRAHRQRQDRLQEMQRLYRYRLDFALAPARELLSRKSVAGPNNPDELLDQNIASSIEMVRRLDEEHLVAIRVVHDEFERLVRPTERASIGGQRDRLRELIADCSGLVITGGHVAVLLNRIRLLGIVELCRGLPLVAWSAGAMVLCDRIVVFHDHPPQGAGNAEVLDSGLGVVAGITPLPHASRRMRLANRRRVSLFARRFAPERCVPLDRGSLLRWQNECWHGGDGVRQLCDDGSLASLEGQFEARSALTPVPAEQGGEL